MGKALALVGSPRKFGNSELAARYIGWEAGVSDVEFIRLNSKNILPCKACYRCLEGKCPLDDDYGEILNRIIEAPGVIITVPSYFFGPNASIKRFLDRGLQFYAVYDKLMGKPAVGLCVAGMESGEGYTKLGLDNMILRMGFDNRGTDVIYGALPGEIFTKGVNMEKLKDLGRKLFAPANREQGDVQEKIACTSCGYPYFSFVDAGIGSCLICGTRYRLKSGNWLGGVAEKGVPLNSEDELTEHREWLINMKRRYLDMREELKKTIREHMRPGKEV